MNKVFNTCRLEVKGFEDYQLNYYFAILQDNDPKADFNKAKEKFKEILNSNKYYAIILKVTQQVIGYIYVNEKIKGSYEVGYLMISGYQNSGYATEALDAIAKALANDGANYFIGNFKESEVKPFTLLENLNEFNLNDFKKIYAYSKD
jgi:hypothetical protein